MMHDNEPTDVTARGCWQGKHSLLLCMFEDFEEPAGAALDCWQVIVQVSLVTLKWSFKRHYIIYVEDIMTDLKSESLCCGVE